MKLAIFFILTQSMMSYYYNTPHYYKPSRGYAGKAVRDNWSSDQRVRGGSIANSQGNGSSTAYTGKAGSQARANGTHGSQSWTKHKKDRRDVRDRFSRYRDSSGKVVNVRDRWAENERNNNHGDAISKGKGYTAAISDDDRSAAKGRGKKGTKVDSAYNNENQNVRDRYKVYNDGHKRVKIRDTFSNLDRVQTQGRGMGIGNGKAITNSNGKGSAVKARGDRYSKGQSCHRGDSKRKRNRWIAGRIGNKRFNRQDRWAAKQATNGNTDSEALGHGYLKTFTNREKGSGAHSNGTRGTNNKAKYNSDEKKVRDSWSNDFFGSFNKPYKPKCNRRRRRRRRRKAYYVGDQN